MRVGEAGGEEVWRLSCVLLDGFPWLMLQYVGRLLGRRKGGGKAGWGIGEEAGRGRGGWAGRRASSKVDVTTWS